VYEAASVSLPTIPGSLLPKKILASMPRWQVRNYGRAMPSLNTSNQPSIQSELCANGLVCLEDGRD
jgi:hypothetical protein